jgi:LysM repeat protein
MTNGSISTTPSAHTPSALGLARRAAHLVSYAFVCAAVSASFLATASTTASARRLDAGLLKCEVDGGVAYVFGSTKDLHCVFYKSGGSTEAYQGKIKKFGLDIGATGGGYIVWTVIAATKRLPRSGLAGSYVGANVDASVGVGAGADVLVSTSLKTLSLQPLSLQGETGLNLAVGIAKVELQPIFKVPEQPVVEFETQIFANDAHYGCGSYYVLMKGDTLDGVSRTCGITVEALLKANPRIRNVRELPVGLPIRVPAYSGHASGRPCEKKVILQPGQPLDELAQKCGVTLHALLVANPSVRRVSQIKPGLVLRMPKG